MYVKNIIVWFCSTVITIRALRFQAHPDIGLSITQTLHKHGYKIQAHEVTTQDGYFITIFRIPGTLNSSVPNKHPVMMVPGTCGCSENFIVAGPGKAIAYYLVDRGFDVWLTNTRGNRYARRHKTMNPNTNRTFWDFGWHEVAVYDTPAMVDYILKVTGESSLIYIGHSQGVTSFFAFASEKPDYNKKIKLSVQMAPSCFLRETRTLVKLLGKHSSLVQSIAKSFDFYEVFPKRWNDLLNVVSIMLCSETTFFVDVCTAILYSGLYSTQMDVLTPQLVLQTSPAGCSVKELVHYFQIIYSGYFRHFDYGPKKNSKIYGSKIPPDYNLTNIDSPVALFYALTDPLVPAEGIKQLKAALPNLLMAYEVPADDFNHVDFIFSKYADTLVYEPIYQLLRKYTIE